MAVEASSRTTPIESGYERHGKKNGKNSTAADISYLILLQIRGMDKRFFPNK